MYMYMYKAICEQESRRTWKDRDIDMNRRMYINTMTYTSHFTSIPAMYMYMYMYMYCMCTCTCNVCVHVYM